MRLQLFAALFLVALFVADAAAAHKKVRKHKKVTTTTTESPVDEVVEGQDDAVEADDMDMLMEDEAALEQADEDGEQEEEDDEELDRIQDILIRNKLDTDPCLQKKCGLGRRCVLSESAEAVCTCIEECPHNSDPRREVCTNHNETWNSACAVYRQRCECVEGLEGCTDPRHEHMHVEYYGQCTELTDCPEEELADFPRRMREWLFNVMKDLAERQALTPHYREMEAEAEHDENKRWINAAIWRWCELDSHPHDRSVSRHELFPIRAPLLAMEHCVSPFLKGCDTNGDHEISLNEWAKCLEVEHEDIKERCEVIKDKSEV